VLDQFDSELEEMALLLMKMVCREIIYNHLKLSPYSNIKKLRLELGGLENIELDMKRKILKRQATRALEQIKEVLDVFFDHDEEFVNEKKLYFQNIFGGDNLMAISKYLKSFFKSIREKSWFTVFSEFDL